MHGMHSLSPKTQILGINIYIYIIPNIGNILGFEINKLQCSNKFNTAKYFACLSEALSIANYESVKRGYTIVLELHIYIYIFLFIKCY